MTSSTARQMGRYEMLFRIASGGMAEVWAARVRGEAGFQKLVAIKRMLPNLAEDEDFVSMFLDEARVAANITSPNVVQTLDLGRDDEGALYIVMELVVGVTLGRVLKAAAKARRVVPLSMGTELLAQAAHGLHDAHEASTPLGEHLEIVHRDISPQNILLGVDGRVRITDFGVAKAVMRITQTDAGRIKGKFAYCSPEQLTSPTLDRRSDVFSLGIVAWETLCGQRLFSADHPLETMKRVQEMPIPAVTQIRTRVPEKVSDVVAWALERDPDKRPDTAAIFGDALRDATRETEALPDARALSVFVKAAGGKTLQKMRQNIQETLTSGSLPYVTESQEAQLPTPSHSSVVSRSGMTGDSAAGVLSLLEERSSTQTGDDDAPTVARASRLSLEPALPTPAPPQRKHTALLIASAVVLLVAGLVAGVMIFSKPSTTRVVPAQAPATAPPSEPVAAPLPTTTPTPDVAEVPTNTAAAAVVTAP
ncbi:MAG: serine/threonine protein kinase, partial [Deltaproteobacteria bacterium]|nr:serine/threonine protein kinase [Deltaproteobacteria bacterium]